MEDRIVEDLHKGLIRYGLPRGITSKDGYKPIGYDRKKYRRPWLLEKDGKTYSFSQADFAKKFKVDLKGDHYVD